MTLPKNVTSALTGAADVPLSGNGAAAMLALRLAGLGTWKVICGDATEIDRWPAHWSLEACRIMGTDQGHDAPMRGRLQDLVHPDDRAIREAVAERAWRQGGQYSVEFRIVRADGSVRVIAEQAQVFPDPQSGRQCVFGYFQDVTERRQIDQTLRAYNALLRGVTRAQARFIAGGARRETFGELLTCLLSYTGSEFGFIGERITAPDGSVWLQLRATAGTGWDAPIQNYYSGHEQQGVLIGEWVHSLGLEGGPFICNVADPPDGVSDLLPGHPPVNNYLLLPFAHEEGIDGVIGLANAAGGYSTRSPRRLEALLTTCASLVWAYRSNEGRQHAEAELVRLNAELEEHVRQRTAQLEAANRELESFSYSVSHDLRAPLRGIDGWSLALMEDYAELLPAHAQEYIERVRTGAQHMGRLIEDLLQLSRVTRENMHWQDVDMTALTLELCQTLGEQQPERAVEVVLQPGVMARGDPGLLRAVMQNLLDNAWKFTGRQAHARVEFGTVSNGAGSAYFVRDNGAGFDMEYAGKMFNPFRRLHLDSEFPGTGIGLATVQRIIRRHGGAVWAESEPGKGATFYFTVAVAGAP